MATEDLKLEFEEEDEGGDSQVEVNVDLQFSSPRVISQVKSNPVPKQSTVSISRPEGVVKKIEEARKPPTPPPIQKTHDLEEKIKRIEHDANLKVLLLEQKYELLADLSGDMKLLEFQVGQLLGRINTKHPDLSQEVLTIKKLLADFTGKKRK